MNILHDKSSVKSFSAKWIDRGYAREDVHSLRLQYVYTPEQREANRRLTEVPVGNCFSGATTSAIRFTAMDCLGGITPISHCPSTLPKQWNSG